MRGESGCQNQFLKGAVRLIDPESPFLGGRFGPGRGEEPTVLREGLCGNHGKILRNPPFREFLK